MPAFPILPFWEGISVVCRGLSVTVLFFQQKPQYVIFFNKNQCQTKKLRNALVKKDGYFHIDH